MTQDEFVLRPAVPEDAAALAKIIRTVMPEFGADGPGFAIHDKEVDEMPQAYSRPGHAYFVVERSGRIVGGGGVGPLTPGDAVTCELRKMYFLPEARGFGVGERLLRRCMDAARGLGYRRMYLETLKTMEAAQKLYRKLGFSPQSCAEGNTGHFGCDRFFSREL
ncbi:MAG: GNAT family N-acetyltransferase [Myxococcaceae bacterium]